MSRPVKELVLVTLLMILGMAACGSLFTILSEVVGGFFRGYLVSYFTKNLMFFKVIC